MSEEGKEEVVFISQRVEDYPTPVGGSKGAARCGQCSAEVWVSPASRPLLEKADRVLCIRCAPPEALDIIQAEPPSPEQVVEVVEALLPEAVKELRELAFAHPWKPVAPPDKRHYRHLVGEFPKRTTFTKAEKEALAWAEEAIREVRRGNVVARVEIGGGRLVLELDPKREKTEICLTGTSS